MLSTFPAVSSSDGLFGSLFPVFQGGFSTWDCQELLPICSPHPNHEPVYSNSGSGSNDSNPSLINGENRKRNSSNSGSEDPREIMERKRRRKISNRESARRSRMRKQNHLENLRDEVNRLKDVNRNMVKRLHIVIQRNQIVRKENERLEMESGMLQQKLCQLLLVRQLEQQLFSSNNFMPHQ